MKKPSFFSSTSTINSSNDIPDIFDVVIYKNLSSNDMRFFLAAGYEPVRNRILKLTDGYFIYDEEDDDYAFIAP